MERAVAARRGVLDAVERALRPWTGKELLSRGVMVYLHEDDGRVAVVTRSTTLDDVLEADLVEVVIQTDAELPDRRAG